MTARPPAADGPALRRLDLVSLSLFEAVAETGSLSAACARLNLALAAGSRRLAELEAALGVRLAERTRTGTRLTPAGEAALAGWRAAAEGLRRLVVESRDAAKGVRGQLRIAATSSVVVQFLPQALGAFLPRHGLLRLDLRETTSRGAAAALREGTVDLALMDALHVPADCEARHWREDRLVAVLPTGHPALAMAARRRGPSAAETAKPAKPKGTGPAGDGAIPFSVLLGHDLVGLDPDTALHAALRAAAEEAGRPLPLRVTVYSFEAVLLLVQAGLGAAVLPDGAVRVAGRGLVVRPLSDPWAKRQHVIAARRFDALPEAARAFVEDVGHADDLRAARRPASRSGR
ncbi:LysR family transcriptional regulator [Roseomonas sp. CCTCC AB2023176]|uniref:LysR family transcriptional regulator n=1 Tax=Roseomonas sp. CCTCC AB2023176 TaxID=3342640 RepID=UPI0035D6EE8C